MSQRENSTLNRQGYRQEQNSYDGFRPDEKASVVMESVKVFDGEQEQDYTPSCWSRFKVLIWLTAAVVVVAAVIAISVTMVETNSGTTVSSSSTDGTVGTPPGAPPRPPGDSTITLTPEEIEEIETEASDEDGTLEIMKNPPFKSPPGWTPLWWEEFEGDSLNLRWWNYQYGYGEAEGLWQWGNNEEQFYTDSPANVKVSDGTLKITARREDTVLPDGYTFEWTSGRINTQGKAAFYGGMTTADGKKWNTVRIEASLKAPQPSTLL